MTAINGTARLPAPGIVSVVAPMTSGEPADWLGNHVAEVKASVSRFTRRCCEEHFTAPDTAVLGEVLNDFVAKGKYLRSTFAYLGWLCGQPESTAAAQAAGGLELLHAFALIQDDVMDESASRRGRSTVHVQLADWHRGTGRCDDSDRFGRSAAILLSDLCLIWAERMLREAGLPPTSVQRAWPVYDLMRSELAVGQYSDLLNEGAGAPTLPVVLDIARRKSGNYSVRRPLELGAALAGCPPSTTRALQRYGTLIGEAFQLRDDLLGVFGDPELTGKPLGDDLRQHKATSVVVLARELASPSQRDRLNTLVTLPAGEPDEASRIEWWQRLIEQTGAPARIEQLIADRVSAATAALRGAHLPASPQQAMVHLADRCTTRDH
jgi:geranylgeranyl diphosphate synthase type I